MRFELVGLGHRLLPKHAGVLEQFPKALSTPRTNMNRTLFLWTTFKTVSVNSNSRTKIHLTHSSAHLSLIAAAAASNA